MWPPSLRLLFDAAARDAGGAIDTEAAARSRSTSRHVGVSDGRDGPTPGEPRHLASRHDEEIVSWLQWVTVAGLIFRCAAAPSSVAGLLGEVWPPSLALGAVLVVLVACVAANGVLVWRTTLGQRAEVHRSRAFLVVDLGVCAALNLAVALALPPGTQDEVFRDVAWFYLVGGVGVWTAVRGPRFGAAVVAAGVPLQLGMGLANGIPLADVSVSHVLVRQLWLGIACVMAVALLPLYRHGRRLARVEGLRAGREAERARQLRALHDTVLQTLEAVALRTDVTSEDPESRLQAVRAATRAQASEIRAMLLADEHDPDSTSPGLGPVLRAQAALATRSGVRTVVALDALDRDDAAALVPASVAALGEAAGEALANVAKHAGVSEAVVTASSGDRRVQVTVRDLGRGFPAERRQGFGLRESVHARMRDAGGGAHVWSAPGSGTVVTLWVSLPR